MIIIDGKHLISIHWKQFSIYIANAYHEIQFELLKNYYIKLIIHTAKYISDHITANL